MTSSGIEAATFWFVAQCFNQLRHAYPITYIEPSQNFESGINNVTNLDTFHHISSHIDQEKLDKWTMCHMFHMRAPRTLGEMVKVFVCGKCLVQFQARALF